MATKVMTQPWLWRRGVDDSVDLHVGIKDEPLVDLRGGKPRLRIMDGVTPGGVILDNKITAGVVRPTITYPPDASVDVVEDMSVKATRFIGITSTGTRDTHVASYWEIATDSAFVNKVFSSGRDTLHLRAISLYGSQVRLLNNTQYYIRVMHEGLSMGLSHWSPVIEVYTKPAIATLYTGGIEAPYPEVNGQFGLYVKVDATGTRLITSSPNNGIGSLTGSGEVYYYLKDTDTGIWSLKQTIKPLIPKSESLFGETIYMSADWSTMAVGARGYPSSSTVKGKAYIFRLDTINDVWLEEAILKDDTLPGGRGDAYGYGVCLNSKGTIAFIGNHGDDSAVLDGGSIYVYSRDPVNGSWSEIQRLRANNTSTGDNFGLLMSISNDDTTLLVGSQYWNNAGAGFIFRHNGLEWVEEAILTSSSVSDGGKLGSTVMLSNNGNSAILGTPLNNNGEGGVYLFTRDISTGLWSEQYIFTPDISITGSLFGASIAFSKDNLSLLIGAPGANSVYLYTLNASTGLWSYIRKYVPPVNQPGESWGACLAIAEDVETIYITGQYTTVSGVDLAGNIYIYE